MAGRGAGESEGSRAERDKEVIVERQVVENGVDEN